MEYFCQQSELGPAIVDGDDNSTICHSEYEEYIGNRVDFGTGAEATTSLDKFLRIGSNWFFYKREEGMGKAKVAADEQFSEGKICTTK